ncbi:hypothetical protein ACWEOO_37135 [Kribbella sp. NPDC004138]
MGETAQLRGPWRTMSVTGAASGLAGLVLVGTSQALACFVSVPYSIFWIWVVAVSIQLFRGRLPERAG